LLFLVKETKSSLQVRSELLMTNQILLYVLPHFSPIFV
jgi:hypothetical protein